MLAGVALDLARQHRPDLILLDLRLPDMPGRDVMQQLRTDPVTRNIPIVILSANATPRHIDELLAAGATAYLTKPIRVRDLLRTLDGILGEAVPVPAQSTQSVPAAQGASPADAVLNIPGTPRSGAPGAPAGGTPGTSWTPGTPGESESGTPGISGSYESGAAPGRPEGGTTGNPGGQP
jgi:CheY-like chemotaxis protein